MFFFCACILSLSLFLYFSVIRMAEGWSFQLLYWPKKMCLFFMCWFIQIFGFNCIAFTLWIAYFSVHPLSVVVFFHLESLSFVECGKTEHTSVVFALICSNAQEVVQLNDACFHHNWLRTTITIIITTTTTTTVSQQWMFSSYSKPSNKYDKRWEQQRLMWQHTQKRRKEANIKNKNNKRRMNKQTSV